MFPRITPADAGKTTFGCESLTLCRDHPRGCGENLAILNAYLLGKGSPPRMRGKRATALFGAMGNRITPADAGKTKRLKGEIYDR